MAVYAEPDDPYDFMWDARYYTPGRREQPQINPDSGTQTAPNVGGCGPGEFYSEISKGCVPFPDNPNPGGGDRRGGGAPESLASAGLPYKPKYNFAEVPKFNAPKFAYGEKLDIPTFSYDEKFAPPTPGSIYDDPSYQFRYDQGRKAAEQAAAARGTSRTGGQWKAMQDYGQNFASQEYGNIYGRARDTYGINFGRAKDVYDRNVNEAVGEFGTNYGVSRDVFDRNYTGAKDEYAPLFDQWRFRSAAEQRAGDLELQNMWDEWKRNNPSWADLNNALPPE